MAQPAIVAHLYIVAHPYIVAQPAIVAPILVSFSSQERTCGPNMEVNIPPEPQRQSSRGWLVCVKTFHLGNILWMNETTNATIIFNTYIFSTKTPICSFCM